MPATAIHQARDHEGQTAEENSLPREQVTVTFNRNQLQFPAGLPALDCPAFLKGRAVCSLQTHEMSLFLEKARWT